MKRYKRSAEARANMSAAQRIIWARKKNGHTNDDSLAKMVSDRLDAIIEKELERRGLGL